MYRKYEPDFKFVIARRLLADLEQIGDHGLLWQRRLVTELCMLRDRRALAGQRMEAQPACKILNTITCLGMPDSYRVGLFSLGVTGNLGSGPSHQQHLIGPTAGEPVG